jgi:hypothetical protein
MHPSEAAQYEREAHFNRESVEPLVKPSSLDEEIALERIAQLRQEESIRYGEDFQERRKRLARSLRKNGLDSKEIGRA